MPNNECRDRFPNGPFGEQTLHFFIGPFGERTLHHLVGLSLPHSEILDYLGYLMIYRKINNTENRYITQ